MMEAGRDLDALVAERVMTHPHSQWRDPVPEYSTDITAAWSVVEHLHGRVVIDHWWGNQYKVMIYIPSSGRPSVEASADTAPEAICRAALASIGQAVVR